MIRIKALFSSTVVFLFMSVFSGDFAQGENIAIFQFSPGGVLELGVEGILHGLEQRGYVQGDDHSIVRFDANGDFDRLQPIATEIVNGGFDVILTVSTPALQAVAAANQTAQIPHVFSLVISPVAADVGIGEESPLDHPPHLTGLATPQPVASAIHLAKETFPALGSIGVAWNPHEPNSAISTQIARDTAQALGIELLEENVEAVADVQNAIEALISRGAEAIWMGGDNTVNSDVDGVVQTAGTSRIPVFTVIPGSVDSGALFDLGPDYIAVGAKAAEIAADILQGANPAAIPIEEYVPEELFINLNTLSLIDDPWIFSDEDFQRAFKVIARSSFAAWENYR